MKSPEEVDRLMEQIYPAFRNRWCGGENGPCACRGCVQVDNRAIMVKEMTGRNVTCDPEYIEEKRIPTEVYARLKITKEEWQDWKARAKINGEEGG